MVRLVWFSATESQFHPLFLKTIVKILAIYQNKSEANTSPKKYHTSNSATPRKPCDFLKILT